MSIGIGLTAGANAWMIGIIGTVCMALITIVMTKIGFDSVSSADYILIFRSDKKEPWESVDPEVARMISWRQLRGATEIEHGKFEYTYNVRLRSKASPELVASELGNGASKGAMRQVTMIAPENHLEL
jgi:uncharacterized membrane protein YhiD involved in acid resistance